MRPGEAGPKALPQTVVDCHRLDLSACDADDLALLDDDERARAGRFRFERDRIRYIAAHAQARRHLGARLGVAPAEVRFTATRHGKPVLAPVGDVGSTSDGALCFNLTHSGAVGYLAVATCNVGIDLELHRAIGDLQPLIDGYCSPAEIAALGALPAASRCIAFLGAWTRKEAALKAWGTGIGAVPLDQLHVGLVPADRLETNQPLPGLDHDGIRYPDLRLASIASGDEVLSVAAACAGSFIMRLPTDTPRGL